MTNCTATDVHGELEFVQALHDRMETGACRGPMLMLRMPADRVCSIERILCSEIASNVFWSGFLTDGPGGVEFELCAAHWFDLSCLLWARGWERRRSDWLRRAEELLQDLCREAGWDPKEIANLFTWRRVRLT